MPSKYEYQMGETQCREVEFRTLVKLVRDGELKPDDLVKAEWESEWKPAAEVVGLFHMAGRDDVLAKWEAEQREKERQRLAESAKDGEIVAGELNEMMAAAELLPDEQKHWQQRLIEAEAKRQAESRERYNQRQAERELERTRQGIGESITSAVDAAELKDQRRKGGPIRRFFNNIFSQNVLHLMFRWGLAFVAANLTAFAILNWSEAELQRYPHRNDLTSGARAFPFWGPCSPGEYFFLLFDTMIIAGMVGYGSARLLESMADD